MALEIKKKSLLVWKFIDTVNIKEFIPSRFSVNTLDNTVTVVYKDGANSQTYNLSEIQLYDLGAIDPFPTFVTIEAFMLKLEQMNCPCFPEISVIGGVQSVVAGTNVSVDNTDPANPIVSASGGGSSSWGGITGTLSDQTDLQNALDLKEYTSNKKTDLEANKTSNTFYASCKAIYDWAVGKFQLKLNYPASDGKLYGVKNGAIEEVVSSTPSFLESYSALSNFNNYGTVNGGGSLQVMHNVTGAGTVGNNKYANNPYVNNYKIIVGNNGAINRGYRLSPFDDDYLPFEGTTFFAIIKPMDTTTGVITYFGYGKNTTFYAGADPTGADGILMKINGNQLTFICYTGAGTTTTAPLTVSNTEWLYVLIEVEKQALGDQRVRIRIKNSFDGVEIYNHLVTTNIPESPDFSTSIIPGNKTFGLISFYTGTDATRNLLGVAYAWYFLKKPIFLKSF